MSEENKNLRVVRKRTVEEVIEVESSLEPIRLENVRIGNENYSLEIMSHDGRLSISFNENDYILHFDEKGISFTRVNYRKNHDHNDSQSLQIKTDESIGPKKGSEEWRSRFPYKGEGWDFKYIEFGPIRSDY